VRMPGNETVHHRGPVKEER